MLQEYIVYKHNPPAHCMGKLFANKTFLQAAWEHCLQILPCCKLHSAFAGAQKPRATELQGYVWIIQ